MLLALLAAVLHGTAYVIYLYQVYSGASVPNPASWSVWALFAILNALTFWQTAKKNILLTAQFLTGSVMASLVWAYAMSAGRFSGLDTIGVTTLVLCGLSCWVWWRSKNAGYAQLILVVSLVVSAIPTIWGVILDSNLEKALPWWIWTGACLATLTNVSIQKYRDSSQSWILFVSPIVLTFVHGIVAYYAHW